MTNKEILEKIKEQYEKTKALAKDTWDEGDHEGDSNDRYYFETGFIAGLSCVLKQDLEEKAK